MRACMGVCVCEVSFFLEVFWCIFLFRSHVLTHVIFIDCIKLHQSNCYISSLLKYIISTDKSGQLKI